MGVILGLYGDSGKWKLLYCLLLQAADVRPRAWVPHRRGSLGVNTGATCLSGIIWGFPKIRGTFWEVPIMRTRVFRVLYWGSLILGNYHIGRRDPPTDFPLSTRKSRRLGSFGRFLPRGQHRSGPGRGLWCFGLGNGCNKLVELQCFLYILNPKPSYWLLVEVGFRH